ncbi:MAG TPA: hypothetical protein VNF29_14070 [Candidatus Binataceae bacterium]|nr:hypothetical protein [Candidatus Binataceae bacterium]
MKRPFLIAAAVVMVLAIANWAIAQDDSGMGGNSGVGVGSGIGSGSGAPQVTISSGMSQDSGLAELQAFDQLSASNPDMASQMGQDPTFVNSPGFLAKYPDLNNFFAQHPGAKDRFLANPGNYVRGRPIPSPEFKWQLDRSRLLIL